MTELNGYKFFFIGVGGIGMSGLARYFRRHGAEVAGYDRTPSEMTNELMREGVAVQFNEDPRSIPEEYANTPANEILVVRTPAVPADSALLKYWQERGAKIMKRAEVLGLITAERRTVAVAGTHGKTTVSTLLAHLLTVGKVKCNAFLGGIAANYGTNVLLNDDAIVNVVEADEYDRSFLKLCPTESIITAMDPDHMDIYGTPKAMFDAYTEFAILCDGPLLVHESIVDHFKERSNVITYALTGSGSPRVENLRIAGGKYVFDLFAEGQVMKDLELGMAGKHNVENAIAAATVALRLGVSPDHLQQGLASFRGVARRFQTRVSNEKVVYIDDYAHHPKELDACIASVRELYPGKRITGIFQPHLFTRTRDNVEDFGKSLAQLDELLLLDIYPAREEPIPGVTSDWLLKHVPMDVKECIKKDSLLKEIDSRHVEVVLTMGAGDIDSLVAPLERQLNQRYP